MAEGHKRGFHPVTEIEITVAVNPFTYEEVRLVPPVKLRTYEDIGRFNDQWEQLCSSVQGNPREMRFELE